MANDKKDAPKIITVPFRVSFPDLAKPKSFQGGEPKYGLQMVFPNAGTPFKDGGREWQGHSVKDLKKIAAAVRDEKWGADKAKHPKKLMMPFVDGNTKDLESHKDSTVINAKSKFQIPAIDADKNEILDMKEIYAGCWARARLTCYAWEIREGKALINAGVNFGLSTIQKLKDDKPFSGRGNPKDDFGAVELEDEEFDEGESTEDEDDF